MRCPNCHRKIPKGEEHLGMCFGCLPRRRMGKSKLKVEDKVDGPYMQGMHFKQRLSRLKR